MINENKKNGICQVCGRNVKLTKDSYIVRHGFRNYNNNNCYGVGFPSYRDGIEYDADNDGLLYAIRVETDIIRIHQEKINNGENTISSISFSGNIRSYPRDKEIRNAEKNISYYKQRMNERGVA